MTYLAVVDGSGRNNTAAVLVRVQVLNICVAEAAYQTSIASSHARI
jgi:hypothetical protein